MFHPCDIAQIANTQHFVAVFANHGNTRHPFIQEDGHHLMQRVLRVDGNHVGASHHHFANNRVAKFKNRVEKLAVFLFQNVLVCGFIHPVTQLIFTGHTLDAPGSGRDDISQHNEPISQRAHHNANCPDQTGEQSHHG